MVGEIAKSFQQIYGKKPLVVASPGRVNLIGEHTDYNEGFVLPGSVDKKNYIAIAENGTDLVNLRAVKYPGSFSVPLSDIKPLKEWATYLLGVIFLLKEKGCDLKGVDILVDGDVPVGAGMSSSAALSAATGFALNELFKCGLSRVELAYISQRTEHLFAGLQCGIMDPFASLMGKAGHLIKLDCRSMEYEYIPFEFPYKIVLVNSMVEHSLAGSEYNLRRRQCEEGVEVLRRYYPDIRSLRDVSAALLAKHHRELDEKVFSRCHYVVTENARLLQGCGLLRKGDIKGFGELMYATHEGLSRLYEVSCPELDFLYESAKKFNGVAGSRMMGGGFGGCTINLVQENEVNGFEAYIKEAYSRKYGKETVVYVTNIEEGTGVVAGV